MNISLPVYVEALPHKDAPTVYQARPLFFEGPVMRGERIDRVLTRLMQDLASTLTDLGRKSRHDGLAAYTFYPPLGQHRLEVTLQLRRRTARCRFLFVTFRQLGRRIAFTPSLPDLWFDLARGEQLRPRAEEVLTRHFRDEERDADAEPRPERFALSGAAHVTPLELTIHPPATLPPAAPPSCAALAAVSTGCTPMTSTARSFARPNARNWFACSTTASTGPCCCWGRARSARPR